jgi:hypothetical protein
LNVVALVATVHSIENNDPESFGVKESSENMLRLVSAHLALANAFQN